MKLEKVNFTENESIVPYCNAFKKTYCQIHCDNEIINDINKNPQINDMNVAGLYQFWIFCISLVIGWSSMAVVVSVSDAICFELLGKFINELIIIIQLLNVSISQWGYIKLGFCLLLGFSNLIPNSLKLLL